MQIKSLKEYALVVADTVVITKTSARVLTKHHKSLSEVSFTINDTIEDDDNGNDFVVNNHDDDVDENCNVYDGDNYDGDESRDETVIRKGDTVLMQNQSSSKTQVAFCHVQLDNEANELHNEEMTRASLGSPRTDKNTNSVQSQTKKHNESGYNHQSAYYWRPSSSSRSSGMSENNCVVVLHDSEAEHKQKITRLLAVRSYHLPGYNCCQDYISWFKNNHPLLGLCCRNKLNPIGTSPRIIILFSSIFFGLIATNLVFLFFRYYDGNSVVKIDIGDDPDAYLSHFEVSAESIVLWTLGGIVHSVVDLALWYLTACACCLPVSI